MAGLFIFLMFVVMNSVMRLKIDDKYPINI